jgi:hypothetical protein
MPIYWKQVAPSLQNYDDHRGRLFLATGRMQLQLKISRYIKLFDMLPMKLKTLSEQDNI